MNGYSSFKRVDASAAVQPLDQAAGFDQPSRSPTVVIRETADAIVIEVDLPGVKVEHLQLSANQGVLTLHAPVGCSQRDGLQLLHREYDELAFHRTFTLPDQVEAHAISAQAKNGVVVVTLPKSKATLPRRIAVAVG